MKRWQRVVVAVAAMAALTGCDPSPVPHARDQAEVVVTLDAEGGADVELYLGGGLQSRGWLLRAGEAVAPALLPGSESRSVMVDDNLGGAPFVRMRAARVYTPGDRPVVELDTREALSVLAGMGYHSVDVTVSTPYVPATAAWQVPPDDAAAGDWYWQGTGTGGRAPAGTIRLQPQPWRAVAELGLTALMVGCLAYAVVLLRRRRRVRAGMAAAVAGAAAATVILTAGGAQGDNLGVAGLVSGKTLGTLIALPMLSLPAVVVAAVVLVVALAVGGPPRPVPRFNPPPGWPEPPQGWTPPPGWQPDPTWPAPPPDWPYFLEQPHRQDGWRAPRAPGRL